MQISDFHNTKSKTLTNDLIEEIKDIAPIYYVSGNHESRSGKYEEIISDLADSGVVILDDKYGTISINDESIAILGLRDPSFYPGYLSEQISYDLEETISSLEDKNNFKILISHRPELFETYVENDVDLALTGHAHGGQIRIPFIGGVVAPDQGFFPKYTSGIFEEGKTAMVVSRGIGNSIFPFRINNRPELVVITINNK